MALAVTIDVGESETEQPSPDVAQTRPADRMTVPRHPPGAATSTRRALDATTRARRDGRHREDALRRGRSRRQDEAGQHRPDRCYAMNMS